MGKKRVACILVGVVSVALAMSSPKAGANGNTIAVPDAFGNVGSYASLVLDDFGRPVVSYYEFANGTHLKLLHCNDLSCSGADESIVTLDVNSSAAGYSSLALDGSGNPVVSRVGNNRLELVHCSDPNCVFGTESVGAPDTTYGVGTWNSLELDGAGNPVVSYYDCQPSFIGLCTTSDLKLLHCNDANCAGGDESITAPDTVGSVGSYTSLAVDISGNPVVTYHDISNGDLKVLHCNDPNCAGEDESITAPDTAGSVGKYTSLALDGAGNPVVSYHDGTPNFDLKVLHCNDPNCAGGDESITAPDTEGSVGYFSSLALDTDGHPVVSYKDRTNLKVLRCNDPNCAGGDETITAPDGVGDLEGPWTWTSLALDGAGNPVVGYHDGTNGDLKVLRCGDPSCHPDADRDGCTDNRERGSDPTLGGHRDEKHFWDFFDTPDALNRRDGLVAVADIARIVQRFGSTDVGPGPFTRSSDPLSAPSPPLAPNRLRANYHPAFDRTLMPGGEPWDTGPPDGAIATGDITREVRQFGHTCATFGP